MDQIYSPREALELDEVQTQLLVDNVVSAFSGMAQYVRVGGVLGTDRLSDGSASLVYKYVTISLFGVPAAKVSLARLFAAGKVYVSVDCAGSEPDGSYSTDELVKQANKAIQDHRVLARIENLPAGEDASFGLSIVLDLSSIEMEEDVRTAGKNALRELSRRGAVGSIKMITRQERKTA